MAVHFRRVKIRYDIIFHIPATEDEFSQGIILPNLMEKLESIQYSAALAVTGMWSPLHITRKIVCRAWLGVT